MAAPGARFGRVPLFFFLLHLPLVHLLAVVACYGRYGAVHWMFESPSLDKYPVTFPPGWGYGLPGVYLVWMIVVVSPLPAVPLVRRRPATADRLVVELFLIPWRTTSESQASWPFWPGQPG